MRCAPRNRFNIAVAGYGVRFDSVDATGPTLTLAQYALASVSELLADHVEGDSRFRSKARIVSS